MGPGGIGKTRTALEYLDQQQRWTRVWFVTLAERHENVADAVAARMNLPGAAAIDRVLSQDDALLVLDNLEHMIDEVATWVTALVDRRPAADSCQATSDTNQLSDSRSSVPGPRF